jgi:hypothetical protein
MQLRHQGSLSCRPHARILLSLYIKQWNIEFRQHHFTIPPLAKTCTELLPNGAILLYSCALVQQLTDHESCRVSYYYKVLIFSVMLCSDSLSRAQDHIRYLDIPGRAIQSWTTGWGIFITDRWKFSGVAPCCVLPCTCRSCDGPKLFREEFSNFR